MLNAVKLICVPSIWACLIQARIGDPLRISAETDSTPAEALVITPDTSWLLWHQSLLCSQTLGPPLALSLAVKGKCCGHTTCLTRGWSQLGPFIDAWHAIMRWSGIAWLAMNNLWQQGGIWLERPSQWASGSVWGNWGLVHCSWILNRPSRAGYWGRWVHCTCRCQGGLRTYSTSCPFCGWCFISCNL